MKTDLFIYLFFLYVRKQNKERSSESICVRKNLSILSGEQASWPRCRDPALLPTSESDNRQGHHMHHMRNSNI